MVKEAHLPQHLLTFLDSDWNLRVRERNIGPHLTVSWIFWDHLLRRSTPSKPASMTSRMILDLVMFCRPLNLNRLALFEQEQGKKGWA